MTAERRFNWPLFVLFTLVVSGCTPGQFFGMSIDGAGSNSVDPTLFPTSTTVGVGQTMTFQVNGGTPPYQFELSGVGSINSSGSYYAGNYAGTAQIEVLDANGNSSQASVSVVQSTSVSSENLYSTDSQWQPISPNDLRQNSQIQGTLVATETRLLDEHGNEIHSKFLRTNLKHPLVRVDELIEDNQLVAMHALIEDQFWVKLAVGQSENSLREILAASGAHISTRLADPGTYLVSLDASTSGSSAGVSGDFLVNRARLKKRLQSIAQVTPHFIARAPASTRSQ